MVLYGRKTRALVGRCCPRSEISKACNSLGEPSKELGAGCGEEEEEEEESSSQAFSDGDRPLSACPVTGLTSLFSGSLLTDRQTKTELQTMD